MTTRDTSLDRRLEAKPADGSHPQRVRDPPRSDRPRSWSGPTAPTPWCWLLGGLALWEFIGLSDGMGSRAPAWLLFPLGIFFAFSGTVLKGVDVNLVLALTLVGGLAAFLVVPGRRQGLGRWAMGLAGALYIGMPFNFYLLLYTSPAGWPEWALFTILAVVASDAAALLVGSRIGRHPFFHSISPRKTVEGAIAGCSGLRGRHAGRGFSGARHLAVACPRARPAGRRQLSDRGPGRVADEAHRRGQGLVASHPRTWCSKPKLLHGPHHDQRSDPKLARAAGLESGGFEQIVKAGQRFLSRPGRHLIGGEERLQIREDHAQRADLPESEVVPHPRSGAGRAG